MNSDVKLLAVIEKKFVPHLIITPNHDIDIEVTSSTNGTDVTASFTGYFADVY